MIENQVESAASRRDFLKNSTVAMLAGASAIGTRAFAKGDDVLRVGLVGCGGRGTGAAKQALLADKNVKLVAIGDAFKDSADRSLKALSKDTSIAGKIAVDEEHKFAGLDAYKKVIECCDVVLLCSPPGFRPIHFKAAIEAGKHVFCEKPVAVDAPGIRSVIETAELAKTKNLAVVSGLCWRYDPGMRATFQQIHDGAIGDIRVMQCTYNTGLVGRPEKRPEWSEMEYQVRNWWFFTWLSGDFNTEQHVHSLDKAAWALKDEYPIRATATGGRQVRNAPEYGHIYDHFNTVFEYASGVKVFSSCRQMAQCDPDVSDHVFGTKGVCDVFKHNIKGEKPWQFEGERADMYQVEHIELFKSIRDGKPINNGFYMSRSSMMAIMSRMSAYTGKTITWEQAMKSQESLVPEKMEWGPHAVPGVAIPGVTKFV